MPEKDITPSVILVTGAGKGIGRAVAEGLAARARESGAPVKLMLAARTQTDLEALAAQLQGGPVECDSVACDLAEAPLRPLEACLGRYGRIDVLIHAAGICLACPLLEMSDDQWRETLRVNLDGSFFITREVAKAMVPQKSGTMVLLTSDRGLYGSQTYAHYAASKGGMIALTKSLALSLGQYGITVNGLNPGMTDTPLARDANPHLWDEKIALDVLGSANLPEQAAQTLLFLAGVGGSFTTGQILGTRLRHGQ
jgi:NAD(P)-dependent dehydrogenase (short-subunit alcohol dehydrogenase family)